MERKEDARQIPVRVYRGTDMLSVAALMPGHAPDDISVEVTADGKVIIEAATCKDMSGDCGMIKGKAEVLIDDWKPGPSRRVIQIPHKVAGHRCVLTYGNGVLVAAFPLADQTTPAKHKLGKPAPKYGAHNGAQLHH